MNSAYRTEIWLACLQNNEAGDMSEHSSSSKSVVLYFLILFLSITRGLIEEASQILTCFIRVERKLKLLSLIAHQMEEHNWRQKIRLLSDSVKTRTKHRMHPVLARGRVMWEVNRHEMFLQEKHPRILWILVCLCHELMDFGRHLAIIDYGWADTQPTEQVMA